MPDFRKPRGKRHPFAAIFALVCCAMLCGARTYSAIAEWGRNDSARIAQALGFTHATPCAATLHTIFRHVDRDACEAHLGTRADSVVRSLPSAPEVPGPQEPWTGKHDAVPKNKGRRGPICSRRWRTMWA